jgi:hypothetical protein
LNEGAPMESDVHFALLKAEFSLLFDLKTDPD